MKKVLLVEEEKTGVGHHIMNTRWLAHRDFGTLGLSAESWSTE
jgi:hypothetical protein